MSENIVSVNNLSVSFDYQENFLSKKQKIKAVNNINIKIKKGSFFGLVGESGSGKTTCLMMLAGFETVTHGEIILDGSSINNVPTHKRNIGMVFQNYALFPHMTVGENLSFPLEVRKIDKKNREEKVKTALEMVQMSEFINRKPAQ